MSKIKERPMIKLGVVPPEDKTQQTVGLKVVQPAGIEAIVGKEEEGKEEIVAEQTPPPLPEPDFPPHRYEAMLDDDRRDILIGQGVWYWTMESGRLRAYPATLYEPDRREEGTPGRVNRGWHLNYDRPSRVQFRRNIPYSRRPKTGCWGFRADLNECTETPRIVSTENTEESPI